MNLSLKWLREFVDYTSSAHEYAEAMTMSGSKVEGYETEGAEIDKVVVGKILSIEKHPDADKLVICQVDIGTDTVQIVTGASNLTVGDLVPAALDGSSLPGGKKIKKGKLRGVESHGMLCSLSELNLTTHDFPYAIEDGIFVLKEDCKLGDRIQEVLGLNDTSVEFEITSNRPDCLSVIGLARETAVTFDKPLSLHTPVVKGSGGDINEMLSVSVSAPDLCQRYMTRIVKDVKIEPSPRWMRERLRASGVRPINNIVDITNYVMLEYCQPMHAFDYNLVGGGKINVRRAEKNETIITLDEIKRPLDDNMLVIADEKRPMAVAGVMGGELSGITDKTATIVFESACFDGPSVRKTAKKIGLRTDSSARFEKGLDPYNCAMALERACELVELLSAGKVVSGVIDVKGNMPGHTIIKLDAEWINQFLGVDIEEDRMKAILCDLGCEINGDNIKVPSWRSDLQHKADISEEIARIYGYGNIPTTGIRGVANASVTEEQAAEQNISDTMLSLGYSEIITYSFISPKYYDKLLIPESSPLRHSVKISNPLGEDSSIMRTIALPSMLEILAGNFANRNLTARLFEIATEYSPNGNDELPDENKKVVFGAYGEQVDYFELKGVAEDLFSKLNIPDYDIEACSDIPWYHPGRCAVLHIGGKRLGEIGQVHPSVVENYGIGLPVYAASLDLALLIQSAVVNKTYHPIPRFPAMTRDLALVCDKNLPVLTIEKAIRSAAGKLLKTVTLFDVYEGAQLLGNKKSAAYSLSFQADDRTLTDEECDRAVKKILKALEDIEVSLRQ